MKLEFFKIVCKTPEELINTQLLLFKLDYGWITTGKKLYNIEINPGYYISISNMSTDSIKKFAYTHIAVYDKRLSKHKTYEELLPLIRKAKLKELKGE